MWKSNSGSVLSTLEPENRNVTNVIQSKVSDDLVSVFWSFRAEQKRLLLFLLFCIQAGAQDDPELAQCLRDAHQFLTITQVQLNMHFGLLSMHVVSEQCENYFLIWDNSHEPRSLRRF